MIARDVADLLYADRIDKMNWVANCPAHEDHEFQLRITDVPGGSALVRCQSGCSIEKIARALGISVVDLESRSAPELDIDDEDLDDAEVRVYLNAEHKRRVKHEIASGHIRLQLREVGRLQRQHDGARRRGQKSDEADITEALEELRRLREIEKKHRVPPKARR